MIYDLSNKIWFLTISFINNILQKRRKAYNLQLFTKNDCWWVCVCVCVWGGGGGGGRGSRADREGDGGEREITFDDKYDRGNDGLWSANGDGDDERLDVLLSSPLLGRRYNSFFPQNCNIDV